jgi:hypothetical protein
MNHVYTLMPNGAVVPGQLLEAQQNAADMAMQDAATERKYAGGSYSAQRRQAALLKSGRLPKTAQNVAPRFEGQTGARWFHNPAWWIVAVLVLDRYRPISRR